MELREDKEVKKKQEDSTRAETLISYRAEEKGHTVLEKTSLDSRDSTTME